MRIGYHEIGLLAICAGLAGMMTSLALHDPQLFVGSLACGVLGAYNFQAGPSGRG